MLLAAEDFELRLPPLLLRTVPEEELLLRLPPEEELRTEPEFEEERLPLPEDAALVRFPPPPLLLRAEEDELFEVVSPP